MNYELKYMYRCLQLAQLGVGSVAPNPMVGAVLVYNDVIIGEGYHRRYGEAHAEPNAINSVADKELLAKSTLYVSLEPCSHFGKTPPCAELIVKNKIPRVVVGTLDPNPKVAGRGVKLLREAGIEVVVGVLEQECYELNKRFFIFQEQKRPYVLLKWAQTRNGFIDYKRTSVSENPLLISNNITKLLTHKMRIENQAILVGTNTVLLDNPSLTARNWTGKSPTRIAIDRQGRIPDDFHLKDGNQRTLIFTEKLQPNKPNLEFIQLDFEKDGLAEVLHKIYERNINSVMIEGGARLLNSFIAAGLWDEANIEISDNEITDGVPAPVINGQLIGNKEFKNHKWLSFRHK